MTEPRGLTIVELSKLQDETVMSHLKAGHDDGLTVIFDRYHHLVFSVGLKILRDMAEAEDVMQSVFLEIYKCAAKFDPAKGTLKVWILQYAYHRSMNRKKYLNLRKPYEQDDTTSALQSTVGGYGSLIGPEIASLLRQGLQQLTPAQKRTIEAVYFRGLSFKEIAEESGEAIGNVYHYYYRGLNKLREIVLTERDARQVKAVRRGVVDAEA